MPPNEPQLSFLKVPNVSVFFASSYNSINPVITSNNKQFFFFFWFGLVAVEVTFLCVFWAEITLISSELKS